jgi:4-hydroxy-tetrahydrodipicolinate synthase
MNVQFRNRARGRHPTSRVYDRDIAALRRGLQLAGLTPTDDPDEDFFVGRHPE